MKQIAVHAKTVRKGIECPLDFRKAPPVRHMRVKIGAGPLSLSFGYARAGGGRPGSGAQAGRLRSFSWYQWKNAQAKVRNPTNMVEKTMTAPPRIWSFRGLRAGMMRGAYS